MLDLRQLLNLAYVARVQGMEESELRQHDRDLEADPSLTPSANRDVQRRDARSTAAGNRNVGALMQMANLPQVGAGSKGKKKRRGPQRPQAAGAA